MKQTTFEILPLALLETYCSTIAEAQLKNYQKLEEPNYP